ncbi:unnamed protein product, partial [Arabidopsis halleri]
RKLKRTEIAALGLRVAVGESVEERERSRFYFPLIFHLQREREREREKNEPFFFFFFLNSHHLLNFGHRHHQLCFFG